MAVKVKFSPSESSLEKSPKENIKVKMTPSAIHVEIVNQDPPISFELNARKTLNGDIMIFDHSDIDIIILTEKKKVVAFAKDIMSDIVYGAESRLFEYLRKRGIIAYDSIQGGNVYGSLEGKLLESQDLDPIKMTLLNVSKWMDNERPYFESLKGHDEMMNDQMLEPDKEDSTELGAIPHEEEKGSIRQQNLYTPYLYGKYTY
tara:strand:+ start:2183 stop:2791 length:609 start_codon:yes stop_codon:yes gene_type:complete